MLFGDFEMLEAFALATYILKICIVHAQFSLFGQKIVVGTFNFNDAGMSCVT